MTPKAIFKRATLLAATAVALSLVEEGQTLGLGTGRAAAAFVRALGARVADGMKIRGVPTSEATAMLARDLSIPLVTLEEAGDTPLEEDMNGFPPVDGQPAPVEPVSPNGADPGAAGAVSDPPASPRPASRKRIGRWNAP